MALLKNILLWTSKNDWMSQKLPKYKFVQNSLSRFMPGELLSDALEECKNLEYSEYGTIIKPALVSSDIEEPEESDEP